MAKTVKVTMPQLGESVHEGTISKWLVKPGDKVVEFEPMMEVETDKVATEVPSPVTGILKEILAADGATVPSGGEIAVVELEGADGAAAEPKEKEPALEAAAPQEANKPAPETKPEPEPQPEPEPKPEPEPELDLKPEPELDLKPEWGPEPKPKQEPTPSTTTICPGVRPREIELSSPWVSRTSTFLTSTVLSGFTV